MAISRELKIKISNEQSTLDSNIHIFRNDRGIDLYFKVINFPYVITNLQTPVKQAGATIVKPDGSEMLINELTVEKDRIKFTITHDMTNEIQEIGKYKIQFHLYDYLSNRVSIPHVFFTVHPLIADIVDDDDGGDGGSGEEAKVGYAEVGKAVISSGKISTPKNDDEIVLFNIENGYIKTVWATGDIITANKLNKIEEALEYVSSKIFDLSYEPIKIQNATISRNSAEYGEKISDLRVRWECSRTPTTVKIDGNNIDAGLKEYGYSETFTNTKSVRIDVSDGKSSDYKILLLNFNNGIYYGTSSLVKYDNAFVTSLTKVLRNNFNFSFTVDCLEKQHIYLCIPRRLGTPTFMVGGFYGGFNKVETITFKNGFNYLEDYDIWKSTNSNLGNTTVNVG